MTTNMIDLKTLPKTDRAAMTAYREEHNCSFTEARAALHAQRQAAAKAEIRAMLVNAKDFEELKTSLTAMFDWLL